MGNLNFSKYLNRFETEVVCKGVTQGIIGKVMLVNVREGKFAYTRYARFLGDQINSEVPFIIDYYGYSKRSKGFIKLIEHKEDLIRNRQIKSIQTKVVFFASIKMEEVAELTSSQYLKSVFSEFKKMILHWRGFEKRKKTGKEQRTARKDRRATM
jgi:hypothetical protein